MTNKNHNKDGEFLCPCCQKTVFHVNEEFDICPICLWQYEKIQLIDPDYCVGANTLSLNKYRKIFLESQDGQIKANGSD
ncbi:CPCC family cysteine-rich protein [Moraxella marmotae]|uniref:CPCC family cysteine-rich protein n=1 Tax=Moraxella marmotae TaxID=3344520 RepID=UPI0035F4CF97